MLMSMGRQESETTVTEQQQLYLANGWVEVLGVGVWECQEVNLGSGLWSDFKRPDVSDRAFDCILCPLVFLNRRPGLESYSPF